MISVFFLLYDRYCGHGSGQEYLGWDSMQKLHCKAAALLMGCSSGKLVVSIICLLCFVFIVVGKKCAYLFMNIYSG